MPKDRNRHYSHYSASYGSSRDNRDQERSPRDREERDRSPYRGRDRDSYQRQGGGYHPYSASYPSYPPYMAERRGSFARGRGGDQSRPSTQMQHKEGGGERSAPKSQGWVSRGAPQPGYSKQPPAATTTSRGLSRLGTRESSEGGAAAEGGREKIVGRGSWRGGRILPTELLVTRDEHLKSKKGSSGQSVTLQANYFKLIANTDWCLYQYDVKYEPPVEQIVVRKGLLRSRKDDLKSYIFDGSILYTTIKYQTPLVFTEKRTSDNTDIQITIQFTKELGKSDYQYLQFFNIIMRKCYEHLKLQLVGRNYFDAQSKVCVEDYGIELWPGYVTSIRQHERDILMSAEITHKVMRQQTLYDIFCDIYRSHRNDFMQVYQNQVIGLVVLTDYNNNTYRIDDVDFEVTPLSSFKKNNKEITYMEYYKQKYNITIHSENQPMLVTRSKPKDRRSGEGELVYLVPELCRATGITDQMKNDYKLMNKLAVHTRVSPAIRIQKLLQFNNRLQRTPEIVQEFNRWNLKLDNSLVEVPGRILEDEIIYIGQSKEVRGENAEWTKGLRSNEMFAQCALTDWCMIIPKRADKRKIGIFLGNLRKVGYGFHLDIQPPKQIEIYEDKASDYTNQIENIMSRHTPQLVCCVAINNRSDRYSAIKKKCAIDRPVPSQVILEKNLEKGGMSVATKIAIQMNCKLGGAPWTVNIPAEGLMIVGFDVCHDTNAKNRDFGAMVASLDKYCTRYFSTVSSHTVGEELCNYFATNLVKALRKFEELNGYKPKRIIVYRDGVSDGEVGYVLEHEVGGIRRALEEAYGDPEQVKLAFILVTKRISTRLFYNRTNAPPGTVVDDVITNPVKYDFFLVSQYVKEGTVSPTAYSVLHNSTGLAPDKIQRLSFKLTHMYFNWCGTVRVPAPCQYAHKLAFLVAQAIHRSPSSTLDSILHFL